MHIIHIHTAQACTQHTAHITHTSHIQHIQHTHTHLLPDWFSSGLKQREAEPKTTCPLVVTGKLTGTGGHRQILYLDKHYTQEELSRGLQEGSDFHKLAKPALEALATVTAACEHCVVLGGGSKKAEGEDSAPAHPSHRLHVRYEASQ